MKFTARQIAEIVQGKVEGDSEKTVSTIAKIEEADSDALAFIANPKYEHFLTETKAAIILINNEIQIPDSVNATIIRVEDAYASFALLMETYQKTMILSVKSGREEPSFVAKSATIGQQVYIGAFSYVGENVTIEDGAQIYPGVYLGDNVFVGKQSTLFAGVRIYPNCQLGQNVIIHSGAVIGADGFGFASQQDGTFKKVPQLGNVVIQDNVEIGANTTIDRATMGSTYIGEHVKVDNLIQIAHNVSIGNNTAIAAQAGISGSTKVGKNCIIGGQAGLAGHLKIADRTRINAQSGVGKSVYKPNTDLNGSPAFAYHAALKSQVIFRKLPEIYEKVSLLEEKLNQLTNTEKKVKSK